VRHATACCGQRRDTCLKPRPQRFRAHRSGIRALAGQKRDERDEPATTKNGLSWEVALANAVPIAAFTMLLVYVTTVAPNQTPLRDSCGSLGRSYMICHFFFDSGLLPCMLFAKSQYAQGIRHVQLGLYVVPLGITKHACSGR
jgi:hypothetical protein